MVRYLGEKEDFQALIWVPSLKLNSLFVTLNSIKGLTSESSGKMSMSAVFVLDVKGKVRSFLALWKFEDISWSFVTLRFIRIFWWGNLNCLFTTASTQKLLVLWYYSQVIISRNYRGDIEMSLIEKFMPLVLEKEEEGSQTPICVHQDVTFVYIKYNNLYRILSVQWSILKILKISRLSV